VFEILVHAEIITATANSVWSSEWWPSWPSVFL